MINVSTEGQVNTTITRRKDTLVVFFRSMGMTVTICGDGSYTVDRSGKRSNGDFADRRVGTKLSTMA